MPPQDALHQYYVGYGVSTKGERSAALTQAYSDAMNKMMLYSGVKITSAFVVSDKGYQQHRQLEGTSSINILLPPVDVAYLAAANNSVSAYVLLRLSHQAIESYLREAEHRQKTSLVEARDKLLSRYRLQQQEIARSNWLLGEVYAVETIALTKVEVRDPVALRLATEKLYIKTVGLLNEQKHGVNVKSHRGDNGYHESVLSSRGIVRPQKISQRIFESSGHTFLEMTMRDATYRYIYPLASEYTGLIIDARGLPYDPALYGFLFTNDGELVWGPGELKATQMNRSGAWIYAHSLEKAKEYPLIGARPLIIKALPATKNADIYISKSDYDKVREHEKILGDNRICIVF